MSDPDSPSIRIFFDCACLKGEERIFENSDPVIIYVSHRLRVCRRCNQNEVNGMNTSIEDAVTKEAEKIVEAYLKAFNHLGRWGFRPKGEGHEDIRINGILIWIKKLQEGLTDLERDQPGFVNLGNDEMIERPQYCFAGQAPYFLSDLNDSELLHKHVSNIRHAQTEIIQKAARAQAGLEEKGFMVQGEFIKVAEKRKNNCITSGDYIEMVPDWDFLEVIDRCVVDLINVVWELKDGKPVQVNETGLRVPSTIVMG
ncbi:6a5981d8-c4dc-4210-a4e4-fb5cfb21ce98 [Sclerotinia trifoliorum]|uniref:6a5981d8-c4dc-4210-a4e4-fb5cfb21ce98 n=1 Tax=Sclerotinia trifoliorum TaxID=28548 RepID=A0A8H2VPP8_9HELO|nr:6a5981d8-c4dc-4210-a4e4-fb5cfb21ce98 [Sclerotinia trifoliorum]